MYCFLRFILPQLCPSCLVKQLQFLWCHWQHHWGLNYLLYLVPPYTYIFSTIFVVFMAYKIIIPQAYDVLHRSTLEPPLLIWRLVNHQCWEWVYIKTWNVCQNIKNFWNYFLNQWKEIDLLFLNKLTIRPSMESCRLFSLWEMTHQAVMVSNQNSSRVTKTWFKPFMS